jgi:hypothetical protein
VVSQNVTRPAIHWEKNMADQKGSKHHFLYDTILGVHRRRDCAVDRRRIA